MILVQVVQEPQKLKQARLTGNISISGKYVALDLKEGSVGVSKRIKDDNVVRHLKELIDSAGDNQRYGLVYRTACENADDKEIVAEYEKLSDYITDIINKATYERKTGILSKEKPEFVSLIEDYGFERIDELKTDISDVYESLRNYFDDNSSFCLTLYQENEYPYYKLLDLETEISRMLNKKVWLKSGGFLIIEHTEAMVVIDVNTGKAINNG